MKKLTPLFCAINLLVFSNHAIAYKEITHEEMSEAAAFASVLAKPATLEALGLTGTIEDPKLTFPNFKGSPRFIKDLIRDGANFEDNFPRSLNHFYDPINDKGLLGANPKSPDWALEDQGDIDGQEYSYKNARQYFYDALTKPTRTERDKHFGKTFQTLGQVIHHLQDMAQPQHVRNDDHCDVWPCKLVPGLYNPSRYEIYSDEQREKGQLPFTGYPSVTLPSPRQFWTNNGQGIADFTNRNFVSAGTNFDTNRYPSPKVAESVPKQEDANVLLQSVGKTPPPECLPDPCVMTFFGTAVNDTYRSGASGVNPRTSTQSIFDQDLKVAGQDLAFSLNRFNFDSAHPFLIPHAVGYSAGLINYFFRGRLEISLPEEGVYSLVDHAVVKDIDQGFTKIKLKLKNTTPDIVEPGGASFPQHMTGGTLEAVAKYHRNGCYRPDLSGELTQNATIPSGCDIYGTYLSGEEQISVSAKIKDVTLNSGQGVVPQAFTFDFSQNPIPINARDVYLQIVYRGKFGSEDNAVAVVTKDISEPTYISHLNSTDYYWINNAFYRPAAISTEQKNKIRVPCVDVEQHIIPEPFSVEYRFGGSRPLALVTLPPQRYSRMAVLTDSVPFTLYTRASYPSDIYCTFGIPWRSDFELLSAANQTDKATGVFRYSWIEKTRGLNRFDIVTSHKAYADPAGGYREPTITEINALDPLTDLGPYQMTVNF